MMEQYRNVRTYMKKIFFFLFKLINIKISIFSLLIFLNEFKAKTDAQNVVYNKNHLIAFFFKTRLYTG